MFKISDDADENDNYDDGRDGDTFHDDYHGYADDKADEYLLVISRRTLLTGRWHGQDYRS